MLSPHVARLPLLDTAEARDPCGSDDVTTEIFSPCRPRDADDDLAGDVSWRYWTWRLARVLMGSYYNGGIHTDRPSAPDRCTCLGSGRGRPRGAPSSRAVGLSLSISLQMTTHLTARGHDSAPRESITFPAAAVSSQCASCPYSSIIIRCRRLSSAMRLSAAYSRLAASKAFAVMCSGATEN